jgi:Na+/H+ antiporter NhaA
MAIFIATLSLSNEALVSAKAGTLAGSFLSMIVGLAVLRLTLGAPDQTEGL